MIPLVVYQSSLNLEVTSSVLPLLLYRLSFAILAALNILVSRLTRRVHGFQSTPLDFLVLAIALIAPQLPQSIIPIYRLGIVGAKIIICYFSCEVVFAELRGNFQRVTVATMMLLAILVVRGFM